MRQKSRTYERYKKGGAGRKGALRGIEEIGNLSGKSRKQSLSLKSDIELYGDLGQYYSQEHFNAMSVEGMELYLSRLIESQDRRWRELKSKRPDLVQEYSELQDIAGRGRGNTLASKYGLGKKYQKSHNKRRELNTRYAKLMEAIHGGINLQGAIDLEQDRYQREIVYERSLTPKESALLAKAEKETGFYTAIFYEGFDDTVRTGAKEGGYSHSGDAYQFVKDIYDECKDNDELVFEEVLTERLQDLIKKTRPNDYWDIPEYPDDVEDLVKNAMSKLLKKENERATDSRFNERMKYRR